LLVLTASACSSDSKTAAPAGTVAGGSAAPAATAAGGAAAGATALTIENSTFGAASVAAGATFTIANKDSRPHTVTDDAGAFSVDVPAGGTATLAIAAAGTYKIHCKIHSSMHGTITVA
jgi:plastocyanin